MKNLLFLAAIIIFIGIAYFYTHNHSPTSSVTPEPIPSSQAKVCNPSELEASMNSDVAAGNAYITLTIKNIASTSCTVIGNNQLEMQYPNSVTNFKTDVKKPPATDLFTLTPGQTIYSLIHYPNGPQCSSKATDVNTGVSYAISSTETVSFKPTTGNTLDIPSCGSESDITLIDLYSFSDKEVLP